MRWVQCNSSCRLAQPLLPPCPPHTTHCEQGFLFRFADPSVTAASKPRGIVDLSTVTDVADGGSTTGRPHSIKLSTATGHICYLCENETSQVGWAVGRGGRGRRLVRHGCCRHNCRA